MQTTTPEATTQELTSFARTMAIAISLVFGILIPWLWDKSWPLWPWIIAGVFLLLGQFFPASLRHFHRYWLRFGLVLGWINSRIILTLVYWLIFTPVALLLALLGKRPLDKKSVLREQYNYRIPVDERDDSHFERPF